MIKPSLVIFVQGWYYLVTAVWPLLHISSFELVTGKKKEHWLVYTVSLMIFSSSIVYLYAGYIEKVNSEVLILSVSNCLVLAFVSTYFSLKGTIRKIYLADALAEIIILILLGVSYVGPS